jgi:uroporphyrinogen decarboxylase
MNHRERVLKALNHEEPDRVPIDIGGMRSTGIHSIAYRDLRQHLGLNHESVKLYDVFQQLGFIDEDVRSYFDADVAPVNRLAPAFGIDINRWKEGQLVDGSPALVPEGFDPVKEDGEYKIKDEYGNTLASRSEGSLYYDQAGVYHPLADADSKSEIDEKYEWQEVTSEEQEFLISQAREISQETDYALMVEFGGSVYEQGQLLRGYKQWYLDIAGNKGLVNHLLDKLVENYLENLKTFIDVLGDMVDIVVFGGDDLGMQDGPQISPDTYRELFMPRHEKLWGYVKENTDWKVFLHSCGSIYKLLPHFIEAGVDIINPVHINASGMEPEKLKREFGDEVVFWGGGCDTQRILPNGTIEEVKEEVKRNIETFAPGGGFVFTPVHNIQPDVSPEKIEALYETAREYGKY